MAGTHRGVTASVIAVMVVAGAGFLDFYILENGLPKDPNTANVVVMILTAWNGLAAAVVGYFFGNSANSDRKSELLAQSTPVPTLAISGTDAVVKASTETTVTSNGK